VTWYPLPLAAILLLAPPALAANVVLVPVVAAVRGQNGVLWETEVRVTNRTDQVLHFSVVDWIGTPGFVPATYFVEPHATMSLGGADVFSASTPAQGAAGLAFFETDDLLLVQAAVLSGAWAPVDGYDFCPTYDGGGGEPCRGRSGAGPIIEGLAFSEPGQAIFLPWLHSEQARRTNLVLINPSEFAARVTVSVRSQDGLTTATDTYTLAPRSYNQTNDFFSQDPWTGIRAANSSYLGGFKAAAASATIVSDTPLLAMGYVISAVNNSLTVSLPR
jgi:hypothetical protein